MLVFGPGTGLAEGFALKNRRNEMLKEMGLTPVWRLRERVTQPAAADTEVTESHDLLPAGHSSQYPLEGYRSPATDHPSRSFSENERRAGIMRMDWSELKASVAACTACPLHAKRDKTVFGVGDENADWLFVGEGPGAEEDAQGEPFVGQAGKLLDNMLAAINLKRGHNAYIANVVKCRPPGNRNPESGEALACEPYLHRQIELLQPKLIVALGKVAAVNLLAREASVASMRGKLHQYRGIPLIVTYHPAYLLRTLSDKAKTWADLCYAVETMSGLQDCKSD